MVDLGLARRCWQWLQRHIHHHHRIISPTKITCKIPNQLRSSPLRFKGHTFVMVAITLLMTFFRTWKIRECINCIQKAQTLKELRSLNRELQLHILELADILVERPSQYARRVEDISLIFKNSHHLLNSLRPHQRRLDPPPWSPESATKGSGLDRFYKTFDPSFSLISPPIGRIN
ncbi:Mediator complex, subunit Med7, partial [Prunus dulcis]